MQIDLKDLELFKKCPVRYYMRTCGYNVSHKSYNDYLHDMYNFLVAAMFYHGEAAVRITEDYWSDIYQKNQDIISEKQWLKGVGYLCNIYDYFLYEKLNIVAVNYPYVIEFPEQGVALSGSIPLIANEEGSKQYTIIDPSFSTTMKTSKDLDHNIKYSAYSKAIRDLYDGTAIIINRNFNLNQESNPILRNDFHYSRLGLIVKNTIESINNELYIPRDDYSCNSCKLCGLCTYWGTSAFTNRNKEQTAAANEANAQRNKKRKGGGKRG